MASGPDPARRGAAVARAGPQRGPPHREEGGGERAAELAISLGRGGAAVPDQAERSRKSDGRSGCHSGPGAEVKVHEAVAGGAESEV